MNNSLSYSHLVDRIKDAGVRPSNVRVHILKYLEEHSHPTAEQIYTALRETMPTLSLASVYNTATALAEAGLIRVLGMNGAGVHYDCNTHQHAHFQCELCGKIFDMDMPGIDCPGLEGFNVKKMDLRFWGVCPHCDALAQAATGLYFGESEEDEKQ
ncbi:MAG: transcriptional repressor [Clostridiales bacterium]|jgi:Fe2+ or Zn2+ uptake regulation protein|nr:transcriptional repressor [Clostridiales bacterium]